MEDEPYLYFCGAKYRQNNFGVEFRHGFQAFALSYISHTQRQR
jgi:hypothetical protein